MGCLGSSLVISVAFLGGRGLWAASVFGHQARKDPRNFSLEEVLGELTYHGKARKGRFFFSVPLFHGFGRVLANGKLKGRNVPDDHSWGTFQVKSIATYSQDVRAVRSCSCHFCLSQEALFFFFFTKYLKCCFSADLSLSLGDLMAIIEFVKYTWFFFFTNFTCFWLNLDNMFRRLKVVPVNELHLCSA